MTVNQLQYHANREIARSNLAKEAETNRANLAKETETKRHNVREEELTQAKLGADYMNAVGNLAKGAGSIAGALL